MLYPRWNIKHWRSRWQGHFCSEWKVFTAHWADQPPTSLKVNHSLVRRAASLCISSQPENTVSNLLLRVVWWHSWVLRRPERPDSLLLCHPQCNPAQNTPTNDHHGVGWWLFLYMLVRRFVPIVYLYQKLKQDDGDDDNNAWNIYLRNKRTCQKLLNGFFPLSGEGGTLFSAKEKLQKYFLLRGGGGAGGTPHFR